MKRFCWYILLSVIVLVPLSAQKSSDYGVFIGASSYFGDINTSGFLRAPSTAVGLNYRYNFNPRQAVRANLYYGLLKGDDLDFDNSFQQTRAEAFTNSVFEMALQYELNFFPYATTGKWWDYTPYFATGIGVVFISSPTATYTPVIPLALGFKINVYKNIGLEVEYGVRKTFYDNFDGLIDNIDPEDSSWVHNNDWYVFAGVTLTWKMFHNLSSCPAYDSVNKKMRKRR